MARELSVAPAPELGDRRRPSSRLSFWSSLSTPTCANANDSVDSRGSSSAQSTVAWCCLCYLLSWLRSSRSLERTTRAGVLRAHNSVVGPRGDQDEIHLSESPDRFRAEGELAG